jgi:hypothetical protein
LTSGENKLPGADLRRLTFPDFNSILLISKGLPSHIDVSGEMEYSNFVLADVEAF